MLGVRHRGFLIVVTVLAGMACERSSEQAPTQNVCQYERTPGCVSCSDTVDCPSEYWKCNRHGVCVSTIWCQVDADCTGELSHCLPLSRIDAGGSCQRCTNDSHCPAATPYCLVGGESPSLFCSAIRPDCQAGNPVNTCPAGQWCTVNPNPFAFLGDFCRTADCATDPKGGACQACRWYSAEPCLRDGGSCTSQMQALCECMTRLGIECLKPPRLTTIGSSLTYRCEREAEAVQACVEACPASIAACGPVTGR
jgi:hypothetical protein